MLNKVVLNVIDCAVEVCCKNVRINLNVLTVGCDHMERQVVATRSHYDDLFARFGYCSDLEGEKKVCEKVFWKKEIRIY